MAERWHVINQTPREVLTPQGTFEASWVVTFQVDPEGTIGSVTVPQRLYGADYVRNLIDQQVDAIKAVHGL